MTLVPPLAVFLAKHPLVLKYDLSSVNEVWCGAAPLSREIQNAVTQRYTIILLYYDLDVEHKSFLVFWLFQNRIMSKTEFVQKGMCRKRNRCLNFPKYSVFRHFFTISVPVLAKDLSVYPAFVPV